MNECVTIKKQQIRSKITIEGLSWGVPGAPEAVAGTVMSFNINRTRGSLIGTMSCTLETWNTINYDDVLTVDDEGLGPCIRVWAGIKPTGSNTLPQLFTGYIRDTKVVPHWDDMRKIVLEITAEDVFTKMRNHKISRRFRMTDAAFAVITGGHRRQGGRMNQLRHSREGSGSFYKSSATRDQFGDHSPLIRTPDPLRRTPNGVQPGKSFGATDDNKYLFAFQPRHLVMKPGDKAIVRLIRTNGEMGANGDPQYLVGYGDKTPGLDLDLKQYKSNCVCFISPSFSTSRGAVNQSASQTPAGYQAVDIIQGGSSPIEVKVLQGDEDFYNTGIKGAFLITMRDWYPAKLMFVDPQTKATAELDIAIVYPHSHETMGGGGPARSAYGPTIIG